MITGFRFLIFYACMIYALCDDFLQNFDYDRPQMSPYFHGGNNNAQYHKDEFLQNVPQKPYISSFKSDKDNKVVEDNFAGHVDTTYDYDKDESIVVDEPIPFISDGTDGEMLPTKAIKYDGDSKFEYENNNNEASNFPPLTPNTMPVFGSVVPAKISENHNGDFTKKTMENIQLSSVTPPSSLGSIIKSTFDGIVPAKNSGFKFVKMHTKKNNQLSFVTSSPSLASITNSRSGGVVPAKNSGFKFVKMHTKKNNQLSFVIPSPSLASITNFTSAKSSGGDFKFAKIHAKKNNKLPSSYAFASQINSTIGGVVSSTTSNVKSDNDNKFIFVTRVPVAANTASSALNIATTTAVPAVITETTDVLPLQESLPSDLQCSGKDGDVFSISSCRRYYIKCMSGASRLVACTNEHDVFSLSAKSCVRKAEARECADVTWWQGTKQSSLPKNTTEPETVAIFCDKRVDGFYQHPSNCSRIVQCFGHDLFEYPPCAHNLAFDQLTGRCEYRGQVEGCSLETTGSASVVKNNNANLNVPVSKKNKVDLPSTAVDKNLGNLNALSSSNLPGGGGSSADLQTGNCGEHSHGDHVVNENDCASFFRCVWDRLVLMECPTNTVFNPELDVCDYASASKNQGCIMKT